MVQNAVGWPANGTGGAYEETTKTTGQWRAVQRSAGAGVQQLRAWQVKTTGRRFDIIGQAHYTLSHQTRIVDPEKVT